MLNVQFHVHDQGVVAATSFLHKLLDVHLQLALYELSLEVKLLTYSLLSHTITACCKYHVHGSNMNGVLTGM